MLCAVTAYSSYPSMSCLSVIFAIIFWVVPHLQAIGPCCTYCTTSPAITGHHSSIVLRIAPRGTNNPRMQCPASGQHWHSCFQRLRRLVGSVGYMCGVGSDKHCSGPAGSTHIIPCCRVPFTHVRPLARRSCSTAVTRITLLLYHILWTHTPFLNLATCIECYAVV
ncbi:hypothetical protein COO60DRAFT_540816 [Scenedesmus sp. NREL 46B-D3]|nr:hypothetical protein COO60DRAFT_540816 [Scenedesmus sp. NREL 46B-D3]